MHLRDHLFEFSKRCHSNSNTLWISNDKGACPPYMLHPIPPIPLPYSILGLVRTIVQLVFLPLISSVLLCFLHAIIIKNKVIKQVTKKEFYCSVPPITETTKGRTMRFARQQKMNWFPLCIQTHKCLTFVRLSLTWRYREEIKPVTQDRDVWRYGGKDSSLIGQSDLAGKVR